jgi:hypothetical protein
VLEPLLAGTIAETQGSNGDQAKIVGPKKRKSRAKEEPDS